MTDHVTVDDDALGEVLDYMAEELANRNHLQDGELPDAYGKLDWGAENTSTAGLITAIRECRDEARFHEEQRDGFLEGKHHGKATAYNNVLVLIEHHLGIDVDGIDGEAA